MTKKDTMKVHYVRVSSGTQSKAVQETSVSPEYKVLTDIISGSIAFSERPQGAKIIKLIEEGKIEEIIVHDISRIGHNNIDILSTIEFFTTNNVNLVCQREGISTIVDGKVNIIAKVVIGILSSLAQGERDRLRERQAEGIAIAKERGIYSSHGGSKQKESLELFMSKKTTKAIVKFLAEKNSLRRTALLSQTSLGLVQKVAKILKEAEESVAIPEEIDTSIGFKGTFEEWLELPENKDKKELLAKDKEDSDS